LLLRTSALFDVCRAHFAGYVYVHIHTYTYTYIYIYKAPHHTYLYTHVFVYIPHITFTRAVRDSFTCVASLTHTCDMTHSLVLTHTCDMTHSLKSLDSSKCVTELIHMCDTTHRNLIARKLLPRGGLWVVPYEELGERGPPLKNKPIFGTKLGLFYRRCPRPPGSSFGNHPKRKPFRGGGFFRSKSIRICYGKDAKSYPFCVSLDKKWNQ